MDQWHPRRPWILLGLGMAFTLVLALPMWVAADTTPIAVAVNASVTFTGGGFAPNESLAIWETGTDNVSNPVGIIQADANGGFTTTLSFPSAGSWTATAHSVNTGTDVVSKYTVGSASSTVPGASPSSSGATTAPVAPVGVGVSTTFSGAGFNANETISVWETPPNGGTPTALPSLQADNTGAFTDSVSFPSAGQWQVTAQGVVSGHQTISPFTVGTAGATTQPVTTGTVGGAGFNGTPASIGVSVTFSGSGFNGNEQISLWTTAPDSTVAALSGIQANSAGDFTTSVTFPSAGNWQVTAQGRDSAHQVIGRYAVTDSSSTPAVTSPSSASTFTSPSTDVPLKATSGTTITYIAAGFNAGEYVAAWVTPPDATASVTPLDKVQASSTGRVAISTSFSGVGLWQITLHGYDSGHQVIGKYQVTASA